MKKIYFFMNAFSDGISGGDLHFIEVAKRIESFKKVVITSLLGKNICESKNLEAQYVTTSREQHFGNVYLTYLKRLFKLPFLGLRPDSGDVLYATSDFLPDVLPACLLRFRKRDTLRVCCIFHLIPHYRERSGAIINNFISYKVQGVSHFLIRKQADIIMVDNLLLKDLLVQKGFPAEKVMVTSMGVDKALIDSVPDSKEKMYDASFLARMHVSKGIFDLVKIWKSIVKDHRDAKLVMIGDGPSMRDLKDMISKNDLEANIKLLGFLDERRALETLKASRVFLFPSHEEGWGIAICEAMACGLPVIAYDLPVYKEVFRQGMVRIPKGDVNKFADSVKDLFSEDKKYEELSRAAKDTASRYNWDEVAAREAQLLVVN